MVLGDVGGCSGRECEQVNAKKFAIIAGAAIVLFYVITRPTQAGQTVQDILGWLQSGAEAIITFLRSIFV
jgi:hypothetical protein